MSQYQSKRAESTYGDHGIESESPLGLVARVYQAARLACRRAERAIVENDPRAKGEAIRRLMACLGFLQNHLDMEQGREVATNLDRLYGYMIRRASLAHVENDVQAIREVGAHLGELGSAWAEAAQRERAAESTPAEAAAG